MNMEHIQSLRNATYHHYLIKTPLAERQVRAKEKKNKKAQSHDDDSSRAQSPSHQHSHYPVRKKPKNEKQGQKTVIDEDELIRRGNQRLRNQAEHQQAPLHKWISDRIADAGIAADTSCNSNQIEESNSRRRFGIMIGTHLCGELGWEFVNAFVQSSDVIGMLLVPCCASKHRREVCNNAVLLNVLRVSCTCACT